jgi:hypothetical protein
VSRMCRVRLARGTAWLASRVVPLTPVFSQSSRSRPSQEPAASLSVPGLACQAQPVTSRTPAPRASSGQPRREAEGYCNCSLPAGRRGSCRPGRHAEISTLETGNRHLRVRRAELWRTPLAEVVTPPPALTSRAPYSVACPSRGFCISDTPPAFYSFRGAPTRAGIFRSGNPRF